VGPKAGLDIAENLAATGIRSPDRPARSQSLYRLSCRAHTLIIYIMFKLYIYIVLYRLYVIILCVLLVLSYVTRSIPDDVIEFSIDIIRPAAL
jgi:hypothetical protein